MLTRRHFNRRFNQASYTANDGRAKTALKKYLTNCYHTITDDKAHCLTASMWKGQIPTFVKKPIQVGEATNIKGFDVIKRVYSPEGKSPTLTTMQGGHREPKVAIGRVINRRLDEHGVRKDNQKELPFTPQIEISDTDKSNCLTTVQKDNVVVQDELYR